MEPPFPTTEWVDRDGRPCRCGDHPLIEAPFDALCYLAPERAAGSGAALCRRSPGDEGKPSKVSTWQFEIPVQTSGGCVGDCRFSLPGEVGQRFRLLLDATIQFSRVRPETRANLLHPVDAAHHEKPVRFSWVQPGGESSGGTRQATASLCLVLNPDLSTRATMIAIRPILSSAADDHPGTRRWLSGAGACPVLDAEVEGDALMMRIDLSYRLNSMLRAVRRELERTHSAPGGRRRQRDEALFYLRLWAFYRTLADPEIASKDMVGELHERFEISVHDPGVMDDAIPRAMAHFIRPDARIAHRQRHGRVHFYLRSDTTPR